MSSLLPLRHLCLVYRKASRVLRTSTSPRSEQKTKQTRAILARDCPLRMMPSRGELADL